MPYYGAGSGGAGSGSRNQGFGGYPGPGPGHVGPGWGVLSMAFQSVKAAGMLEQLEQTIQVGGWAGCVWGVGGGGVLCVCACARVCVGAL